MNLSLGVMAILIAVSDSTPSLLINASLIIMLAALTDRFDGKVARLLGATSELGKELDSLSDLISFGVAPIIISWKLSFVGFGIYGYIPAIIFPITGAYRLARFNINTFENVFIGVPITIAGALLSIVNLYNCSSMLHGSYADINSYVTYIISIALAFLMVSKFKVKKR